MIPGIDVSEFQGSINWSLVRQQAVFAMVRASMGGKVDGAFDFNWQAAKASGVLRAAYHFAYPQYNSAASEAQHFLQTVGPLETGDVLALDIETGSGDLSGWVREWCDAVSAATGVHPLIYASLSFYTEHNITFADTGGAYGSWVADWTATMPPPPAGWPFIAIWQHTDAATCPGITGRVDADFFNGDAAHFALYGKQGGIVPPAPPPPPPAPSPPPAAGDYIVRGGDTLSAIAAAHGVTLMALEAANRQISNPNLIFPGQVVHLPGGHPNPAPVQWSHEDVVRSGDTLSGIAARHGVSLLAVEQLNPQLERGHRWSLIYPGDVVHLP